MAFEGPRRPLFGRRSEGRSVRTGENLVVEAPSYPIHVAALERAKDRVLASPHFIKLGDDLYEAEMTNIFVPEPDRYEIVLVDATRLELESDDTVEVFTVNSIGDGEIKPGDYVLNGMRKSQVRRVDDTNRTGEKEVRITLTGRDTLVYSKDDPEYRKLVYFRPVEI